MSTVVIALDGGQQAVAAITKDSAEMLELAEGDAVLAVISRLKSWSPRNRDPPTVSRTLATPTPDERLPAL
jgi:TOBE domain